MRTKPITITRFGVWALLVVFGGVSLGQTGCSTKTPKYPEDHDRFQRVVQAIKTLEIAYVNKDTTAFHELLLPLEQLEILEAKVQEDFSTFATIQVDLTIDRLVINESRISAFISWQGAWQRSGQESRVESTGHGVLLWSGTQVVLLRGVEGDLPFGITSRLNLPS